MSAPIIILNGPNLNLLGERQPEIYGTETLADIQQRCQALAQQRQQSVRFEQSNHEGQLIEWIHEAHRQASGLILNAGAYTHSSPALYDALGILTIPIIELHLSNVFQREAFRHHSYVSPRARAVMCGFGAHGYELALTAMMQWAEEDTKL